MLISCMHGIHLRVLVQNCGTSDMLNLPIHVHLFVLSGLAFVAHLCGSSKAAPQQYISYMPCGGGNICPVALTVYIVTN